MTFPSQLPDCNAYTWLQADAPVIKSIREEINLPTHVCRNCAVRLSSLNNQQQWRAPRAPSHRSLAPVGGLWVGVNGYCLPLVGNRVEMGINGYPHSRDQEHPLRLKSLKLIAEIATEIVIELCQSVAT